MRKHFVLLLILVLLVGTMAACGGSGNGGNDGYLDGVYEGEGEGFGGSIKVSVEVKDGKIAAVDVIDHSESEGFSEDALKNTPSKIVSGNSTDVDAESGATSTSDGIKAAVEDALKSAK